MKKNLSILIEQLQALPKPNHSGERINFIAHTGTENVSLREMGKEPITPKIWELRAV